jgi:hypothetical protein
MGFDQGTVSATAGLFTAEVNNFLQELYFTSILTVNIPTRDSTYESELMAQT